MLITPNLAGQPLRLDGGGSFSASDAAAARGLAAELERDAASIGGAKSSLRRLAAAVIRSGASRGPQGARVVLLGLTLAQRLPSLDALIDDADPTARARTQSLLSELAAALPDQPDDLAVAVRDALAPLAPALIDPRSVRLASWFAEAPAPAELALDDRLLTRLRTSAIAADRIDRLNELLRLGGSSPIYRGATVSLHGRLTRAGMLLAKAPAWLPTKAADTVAAELVLAIELLSEDPSSLGARRSMERLELMSAIVLGLAEAKGLTAVRAQIAATTLLTEAHAPRDDAQWLNELSRLRALARAAELISLHASLARDQNFVRQLRPAARTLGDLAAISAAELLEVFPDALTNPDTLSTPRFVASLADHRRRIEDLRLLGRVDAVLARDATGPREDRLARDEFRPVAEALLRHAKSALDDIRKGDVQSRQRAELSLGELRRTATTASDALYIDGESDLRGSMGPDQTPAGRRLREALGPLAEDIISTLDSSRKAWLLSLLREEDPKGPPAEANLRQLARVIELANDAAGLGLALSEEPAGFSANAWPGFEAAREWLRPHEQPLRESLQGVAALVLRTDQSADRALAEVVRRHAAVLAAGRLVRFLAPMREQLGEGALPSLTETAAGSPPADAWMRGRLDDLALVSWLLMESAASPQSETITRTLTEAAQRAVRDLVPPPPDASTPP